MHSENLKYLELMALVGCTDKEISDAFGCILTPELLEHIQKVREFSKRQIPRPTPQAVARERPT